MSFLSQYKWVILFYSMIIIIVFAYRRKFDVQGIIALYRTKIGLRTMEKVSSKYREIIKLLGYIGIGAAYIGLVFISYIIFKNFFDLLFVEGAKSAVTPVLPGVKVPGTSYTIPLVTGWIALFIVIVIHEFSHGVVARAHKLRIKSSGLFFLGPLMGAFVEPDEKELRNAEDVKQYSILAAGPFSNMLTAVIVLLLLFWAVTPVQGLFVDNTGFELIEVLDDYPAQKAGLEKGMVITSVNNAYVGDRDDFVNSMKQVKAGETVKMDVGGNTYNLVTIVNPKDNQTAYLGVLGKTNLSLFKPIYKYPYAVFMWIVELLQLLGALSLGIGLINLFPIFITDGARMLQVSMLKIDKKSGFTLWKHTNIFCLLLLIGGLVFPLFRWLIGGK